MRTVQSSLYTWEQFKQILFKISDAAWSCSAFSAEKVDVGSMFFALYVDPQLETQVSDLRFIDVRNHSWSYRPN